MSAVVFSPDIFYIYSMQATPRNINPFTDFGFKKLFGEEATKNLLLDFINAVLEPQTGPIASL